MAENEDGQVAGESFSQLLFAADDLGLDSDSYYNYTSSFSPQIPPKMLCFGDNRNKCEIATPPQKSGATCRNSSPASSTTNAPSKKKRNGSGKESVESFVAGTGAPASSQRNCRKRKSENPTVGGGGGHGKVKREKLGERITALQQLVSPYGKTDTASVLHEAMGYIRFLQEQAQVLCSPYLKTHPSSLSHFHHQEGGQEQPGKNDLRSRGLCLVPVESIAHVSSNNNGADYWSPAAMGNHVSPNH
ncbi:hypothetical protein RHMOL_Rhmol11G0235200 [Rhododendron molle]|uniref:Uncharacterized protein n=1 Tax=Rhododendron molle TaxID=49168 RepID=A0ACC0LX35_RHOML|nr:hypothetical protein RHMOL_Rhmol11G0235200 [Rhododendron molle]